MNRLPEQAEVAALLMSDPLIHTDADDLCVELEEGEGIVVRCFQGRLWIWMPEYSANGGAWVAQRDSHESVRIWPLPDFERTSDVHVPAGVIGDSTRTFTAAELRGMFVPKEDDNA